MVNIMSGLSTAMAGSGYLGAFLASFLMILCAEIGDKTFFIAAVLSMKHNHIIVFLGAIGALALMTVRRGRDAQSLGKQCEGKICIWSSTT